MMLKMLLLYEKDKNFKTKNKIKDKQKVKNNFLFATANVFLFFKRLYPNNLYVFGLI